MQNWLIGVLLGVMLILSGSGAVLAQDSEHQDELQSEASLQKLQKLRREIDDLNRELQTAKKNKLSAEVQLRFTEKSINTIHALLRSLESKINRQHKKIIALRQRQSETQQHITQQKNALAQQLLANYRMGQQPYLKLLLNQQNPQQIARTVTYFDYYHKARIAQIKQLNDDLTELKQVQQSILSINTQLEQDKKEKLADIKILETHRKHRVALLASLNSEITQKGVKLNRLRDDEQRLAKLVQQIQSEPFPETFNKQPFHQLKGRLPWPVNGSLRVTFGSERNIGQLKWQGVLIASPSGDEVRAISHGRVAFADWFRGFGLLLIIDHGNGYMSLYAHNESLFKEIGDWVEANEVIARVGNGNGNLGSGLYFEIRHNGKPIDPVRWCTKTPKG